MSDFVTVEGKRLAEETKRLWHLVTNMAQAVRKLEGVPERAGELSEHLQDLTERVKALEGRGEVLPGLCPRCEVGMTRRGQDWWCPKCGADWDAADLEGDVEKRRALRAEAEADRERHRAEKAEAACAEWLRRAERAEAELTEKEQVIEDLEAAQRRHQHDKETLAALLEQGDKTIEDLRVQLSSECEQQYHWQSRALNAEGKVTILQTQLTEKEQVIEDVGKQLTNLRAQVAMLKCRDGEEATPDAPPAIVDCLDCRGPLTAGLCPECNVVWEWVDYGGKPVIVRSTIDATAPDSKMDEATPDAPPAPEGTEGRDMPRLQCRDAERVGTYAEPVQCVTCVNRTSAACPMGSVPGPAAYCGGKHFIPRRIHD